MSEPIRVVLANHHAMVRDAWSAWLAGQPDIDLLGSVCDAPQAAAFAREQVPDVLLLDAGLPGDPFLVASGLRAERTCTRVLFVSTAAADYAVERAIEAGAVGFFTMSAPLASLGDAIRAAARGDGYFSPDVAARLRVDAGGVRVVSPEGARIAELTRREREVIRHLACGLSKKEVAQLLCVGTKTIEKHAENLMAKLEIHDRVALARFAVKQGLAEW